MYTLKKNYYFAFLFRNTFNPQNSFSRVTFCNLIKERNKLKIETAQRILWFAIILNAILIVGVSLAAFALIIFAPTIDWVPIITDPTVLAFIQANPYVIPFAVAGLAVMGIIYVAIIYNWRKDPVAHRTGLTILGILSLLGGWSLPGFLILLPGLLMESDQ